jgi:Flp pilus assembly pilin Flp
MRRAIWMIEMLACIRSRPAESDICSIVSCGNSEMLPRSIAMVLHKERKSKYPPPWNTVEGEDTNGKAGSVCGIRQGLVGVSPQPGSAVGCNITTTPNQRGSYMVRRLLKDESGQTMLEYVVIVVFVVIAAIVGFRLIKGTVHRSVQKASASIEQ